MRRELDCDCRAELAKLEAADLRRHIVAIETPSGPHVRIDGRDVVLMCSNDYLGLAADPRLAAAAARAAKQWGTGSGASRLISGATVLHSGLESRLAAFEGTQDCVLFSSGYLANVGTIPVLVGRGDLILSDERNHASIIDGCRLSRAEIKVYPHCDADAAESILVSATAGQHAAYRRTLVVTDSVFSMDGDLAPLQKLADMCDRYGAWFMVDEAHATGVVGDGRGAVHAAGLTGAVSALVGTCSKALGSLGGYVVGSRALCDLLRNKARTFVFDTALPGPVLAATLAALDIVESEPERVRRVREHARRLASSIRTLGYDVSDPAAAVVPVVVGASDQVVRIGDHLLSQGVLARPIRPPTVPECTARIRLCPMATHTDDDIDKVVDAFAHASRYC